MFATAHGMVECLLKFCWEGVSAPLFTQITSTNIHTQLASQLILNTDAISPKAALSQSGLPLTHIVVMQHCSGQA